MARKPPPSRSRRKPPPPRRRKPPPRRKKTRESSTTPPAPSAVGFALTPMERKEDQRFQRNYKRMLRANLAFYATEMLRGTGSDPYKLGQHHVQWSDAAITESRILALAARDHGKSFFWCFAYPLWMADVVAPGRIGYIFSDTREQAIDHLTKIRNELLGGGETGNGDPNPKLAHLLPLKIDSKTRIKLANNSEIRARGFNTGVRGGHPFWIVCDDIGNDEWIWSETVRNKATNKFKSVVEPMVVPGGQMVVVGTPFHATDVYYEIADTNEFYVMQSPAILPDGTPLWPGRYDMEALERKKRILNNSLLWSREFLVQPISDEASLFPSELFDAPGVKQPYRLGLPRSHWERLGITCVAGVDLAMSSSAGADYMVVIVLGIDKNGNRWIVDIVRRKGLGYQDQVDTIVRVSKHYDCQLVFCESNQFQRVISDMVVRTSDVPIKAFYTTGNSRKSITAQRRGMSQHYVANKNALDQGIPMLRIHMENGKFKFPWASESRETVKVLIDEMQAFGWAEGKMQGVGAHDDTVMALWIAEKAAELSGGMSVSFGPESEAAEGDWDGNPWADDFDPDEEVEDFMGSGLQDGNWRPNEGVGVSGTTPGLVW